MDAEEMKARTKAFGLRVIRLVGALPGDIGGSILGRQLLKSGTSVGANYRAACRARSRAEFIAKLGIVEEEVDESLYWMEMITEAGLMPEERVRDLHEEGGEILSIVVSSIVTAKGKRK